MNDLIQYFVSLGMTPEVAVQLASKVSVMTPPAPPIANGVKSFMTPGAGEVTNLLTNRYHMSPEQATAYAAHVISGHDPESMRMQDEAMVVAKAREDRYVKSENTIDGMKLAGTAENETSRLNSMAAYANAAHISPDYRSQQQKADYDAIDRPYKLGLLSKADQYVTEDRAKAKAAQDKQDRIDQGARTVELRNKGLTTDKGEE